MKGLIELAAEAMPIIGGAGGAALGTLAAPGLGTAAGGMAGSGMGEYLRQRMLGEKTNAMGIAGSAALGALPGAGMMGAKAARTGARGYLRDRALKKISPIDATALTDYSDYVMKRYRPSASEINDLIANARKVGAKAKLDVVSGTNRGIELRIGEALERAHGLKGALVNAEQPPLQVQRYHYFNPRVK